MTTNFVSFECTLQTQECAVVNVQDQVPEYDPTIKEIIWGKGSIFAGR